MAIKKLGLDLGNSTIKIAALTDDNRKVTSYIPSAFDIRSGDIASSNDKVAIVTCNDKTIYLGEGISLNAVDKTTRQFFEHQVLYAAWRSFGAGSYVVKLATGLPIKSYKTKGAEYEEKLNEIVKIQGEVNGEKITVNIDSVKVCAEGYSSLISLDDSVSTMNPTLIIDIGYKTIDVLSVRWDDDRKSYVVEDFDSINIGLYDILRLMSERLLKEGADIKPEELNKRLNSSNSIIRTTTGSGLLNLKTSLNLADEKYEEIIRELELRFGQLIQFDLLFTGGGSKIFLDGIGEGRLKHIKQIPDDEKYYSNVLGYLEQLILDEEE